MTKKELPEEPKAFKPVASHSSLLTAYLGVLNERVESFGGPEEIEPFASHLSLLATVAMDQANHICNLNAAVLESQEHVIRLLRANKQLEDAVGKLTVIHDDLQPGPESKLSRAQDLSPKVFTGLPVENEVPGSEGAR